MFLISNTSLKHWSFMDQPLAKYCKSIFYLKYSSSWIEFLILQSLKTLLVIHKCFHSQDAESISGRNKINADNYHYFSYDNKGGTSGIARGMGWTNSDASGSVCWRDKKRRTAISEWIRSDAETAMVIHLKWEFVLYIIHREILSVYLYQSL